jgi:hypothetical protein
MELSDLHGTREHQFSDQLIDKKPLFYSRSVTEILLLRQVNFLTIFLQNMEGTAIDFKKYDCASFLMVNEGVR